MSRRWERAGHDAEDNLFYAMIANGLQVRRDANLDRPPHCLDILVEGLHGRRLPRPLEIQVTLELDNDEKMRSFADGTPATPDGIRLYLELFDRDDATLAATHVKALAHRWLRRTAPTVPLFLRLGEGGRWLGHPLDDRLNHLERMNAPTHPSRVVAYVVDYDGTEMIVAVADDPAARWVIPHRFLPRRFRREFERRGRATLITVLPGFVDSSGLPLYLPRLFTPRGNQQQLEAALLVTRFEDTFAEEA